MKSWSYLDTKLWNAILDSLRPELNFKLKFILYAEYCIYKLCIFSVLQLFRPPLYGMPGCYLIYVHYCIYHEATHHVVDNQIYRSNTVSMSGKSKHKESSKSDLIEKEEERNLPSHHSVCISQTDVGVCLYPASELNF